MALTVDEIGKGLQTLLTEQVNKKNTDPKYQMYITEKQIIELLNAESDEDKYNVKVCLSSFVETVNRYADAKRQIETDLDDNEKIRAKAFRKRRLEP